MTTITPTIGRIVWFHPGPGDDIEQASDGQPLAAIVARVWSPTMINLGVFDVSGKTQPRTSVLLWQGDGDRPSGHPYCEWMPYQLGQAKAHLDQTLVAGSKGAPAHPVKDHSAKA